MALHGSAQTARPRARDLGVPFDGTPGRLNAITDVAGVEVGMTTLVDGDGKDAVRSGVTAVLPRGKGGADRVFAGWSALNGNGEMTGTAWIHEAGWLEGPILITNTHSVGVVRDAVIRWQVERQRKTSQPWSLPVVAETWDGFLNDINGFHVTPQHVFAALDRAVPGPVPEGNTGGGTGMICHGFKGGTGTASRKLDAPAAYTVGALVQANHGTRPGLRIAGVPVGREIADLMPDKGVKPETGSIIVVVATDAPLLPHQLRRVARRCGLGLARNGGIGGNSSGDLFVAFSTAPLPRVETPGDVPSVRMLPDDQIDPIFQATIEATEEAIVNALIAAETMTGVNGNTGHALPHDRLREALRKYNRLR